MGSLHISRFLNTNATANTGHTRKDQTAGGSGPLGLEVLQLLLTKVAVGQGCHLTDTLE